MAKHCCKIKFVIMPDGSYFDLINNIEIREVAKNLTLGTEKHTVELTTANGEVFWYVCKDGEKTADLLKRVAKQMEDAYSGE